MTADPTQADLSADEGVKPVVGMIHLGALPGTPRHERSVREIVEEARREARLYRDAGVDCLLLENMHDVPYTRGAVGPEIVAAMTMAAQAVRASSSAGAGVWTWASTDGGLNPDVVLVGIGDILTTEVLAAADSEALAVAHAAGLDFIRTECFAFAHVADEGIMESNAARLLRYRRAIGATAVQVWADIKKKHSSHAWTADLSLGDVAEAAEFMGAETIIVTGASTGRAPTPADVEEARGRCQLPVFVGSGVTRENAADFLAVSDGVIIGSYFKQDGLWSNAVDFERVRVFMAEVTHLQSDAGPTEELADPSPAAPGSARRLILPPFPQQPRQ